VDFWVGTMANSETPKLSPDSLVDGVQQLESPLSNALFYKKDSITNCLRDTAKTISHCFDGIHEC
jgi:hypothetical protein